MTFVTELLALYCSVGVNWIHMGLLFSNSNIQMNWETIHPRGEVWVRSLKGQSMLHAKSSDNVLSGISLISLLTDSVRNNTWTTFSILFLCCCFFFFWVKPWALVVERWHIIHRFTEEPWDSYGFSKQTRKTLLPLSNNMVNHKLQHYKMTKAKNNRIVMEANQREAS